MICLQLTFFIGLFDHDLQLAVVELLTHCVQNGRNSVGLDEASFALIEHGEGLLQHCNNGNMNVGYSTNHGPGVLI